MKIYIVLIALFILPITYAHESCNSTETNTTEILPEGFCNIELSLSTDKLSYNNGEKIEIYNNLTTKKYPFLIEYWIENSTGNIIKKKMETENLNTKQFTPNLQESQNITIKNNLTTIDCININNKTYNELNVFIEVKKDPTPLLNLDKLYIGRSKKISIGNNLTAQLTAYSGNLTELKIKTFIENITNISEYIVQGNFNKTTFNTTLEIPNNCNITTGDYQFVVQALDKTINKTITVTSDCTSVSLPEIEINNLTRENTTYENIINPGLSSTTGRIVYESTNEKARNIATYLAIAILVATVVIILLTSKNTEKALKKTTEEWSSQLEQQ